MRTCWATRLKMKMMKNTTKTTMMMMMMKQSSDLPTNKWDQYWTDPTVAVQPTHHLPMNMVDSVRQDYSVHFRRNDCSKPDRIRQMMIVSGPERLTRLWWIDVILVQTHKRHRTELRTRSVERENDIKSDAGENNKIQRAQKINRKRLKRMTKKEQDRITI